MSQFRNLVFEGGGVKGISYVGALQVLEEQEILRDITRIGGTSAGAINAVLLACGYTHTEQQDIMGNLDFNRFLDDSWGIVRDINRLITDFGWHKGDFFRDWIGDLIGTKLGSRDASFRDFQQANLPSLYLFGSNLSTGFSEVFSIEHTPTLRVVDAVCISMSLPLFFAAIRNARRDVFVDGGLLNNYPVKIFDRLKYIEPKEQKQAARKTEYYESENKRFLIGSSKKRSPYVYNRQTLGFRLDTPTEIATFRYGDVPQRTPIEDFLDYTKALVRTLLNAQEISHLHSDDWQRTIYINALGVSTTDFDLDQEKKDALVDSGRVCTKAYFEWFNDESGSTHPVNRA